jgi:hypothetical protein
MTQPATCSAAQHFSDVEPTGYSSPGPCLSFPFLQIFTRRCCGPHVNQRCPAASSGVVKHLDHHNTASNVKRRTTLPRRRAYCCAETCASFPSLYIFARCGQPPKPRRLDIHTVLHVHFELGTGSAPLTLTHPFDPSQRCMTIHRVQWPATLAWRTQTPAAIVPSPRASHRSVPIQTANQYSARRAAREATRGYRAGAARIHGAASGTTSHTTSNEPPGSCRHRRP